MEDGQALAVGDHVTFSDSTVVAVGIVVEELEPDYLLVKWSDWPVPTTHGRHALELAA
jgi:hypothetical protein